MKLLAQGQHSWSPFCLLLGAGLVGPVSLPLWLCEQEDFGNTAWGFSTWGLPKCFMWKDEVRGGACVDESGLLSVTLLYFQGRSVSMHPYTSVNACIACKVIAVISSEICTRTNFRECELVRGNSGPSPCSLCARRCQGGGCGPLDLTCLVWMTVLSLPTQLTWRINGLAMHRCSELIL